MLPGQQISEFAVQGVVAGIEFERFAELVDVGIAVGKLFARQFGGAGFTAARGGQKRGHHAFGIAAGFLDARQFEQHGFPRGQKLERRLVIRGREIEFVALLGELGQFVESAEGGRGSGEHLLPARDSGGERSIDVLERLGRRGAESRVASAESRTRAKMRRASALRAGALSRASKQRKAYSSAR